MLQDSLVSIQVRKFRTRTELDRQSSLIPAFAMSTALPAISHAYCA